MDSLVIWVILHHSLMEMGQWYVLKAAFIQIMLDNGSKAREKVEELQCTEIMTSILGNMKMTGDMG